MLVQDKLLIGKGEAEACILPEMANRHGLIAGATGTGKTVTLKVMAESFSDAGVPVFLADIKGDLAGCAEAGTEATPSAGGWKSSASPGKIFITGHTLSASGMYTESRDIRCGQRSAKWALSCSRGSLV